MSIRTLTFMTAAMAAACSVGENGAGLDIVAGSLAASGSVLPWLQGVPRAVPLP